MIEDHKIESHIMSKGEIEELESKFGMSQEEMREFDIVIKPDENTPDGLWDDFPAFCEKHGLNVKVIGDDAKT